VINDRRPCNCFGAASSERDLASALCCATRGSCAGLDRNRCDDDGEPTAMLGTVLLGCGFLACRRLLRAHVNVVVLVGTDDDAAALGETARTLESAATARPCSWAT